MGQGFGFLISAAFRTLLIACAFHVYMEVGRPYLERRVSAALAATSTPVSRAIERYWTRVYAEIGLAL